MKNKKLFIIIIAFVNIILGLTYIIICSHYWPSLKDQNVPLFERSDTAIESTAITLIYLLSLIIINPILLLVIGYQNKNKRNALLVGFGIAAFWVFLFVYAFMKQTAQTPEAKRLNDKFEAATNVSTLIIK